MPQTPTSTVPPMPPLTGFDAWPVEKMLEALLKSQHHALEAVNQSAPSLIAAAQLVAHKLTLGGRLFYAGAGTSIRVCVLDGAELPGTFGLAADRLGFLVAGGMQAMFETLADAEDDELAGTTAASLITAQDVLITVAASGQTPYTVAAAKEAAKSGAAVIAIVNKPHSPLGQLATIAVCLNSGEEVITGSTRMAAGTAQKIALNSISTLAFTMMGAVYEGLMVSMQAGNHKLIKRAEDITMQISGASEHVVKSALAATNYHIKTAILMCKANLSAVEATHLLASTKENLRQALALLQKTDKKSPKGEKGENDVH